MFNGGVKICVGRRARCAAAAASERPKAVDVEEEEEEEESDNPRQARTLITCCRHTPRSHAIVTHVTVQSRPYGTRAGACGTRAAALYAHRTLHAPSARPVVLLKTGAALLCTMLAPYPVRYEPLLCTLLGAASFF